MGRPLLTITFLLGCVNEVAGTQAMLPTDRRPLLRRQHWYPEKGERFAPSTAEDSAELVEDDYGYGGAVRELELERRIARLRRKMVSSKEPQRGSNKHAYGSSDDGAALYEARTDDSDASNASIAIKLATDATARMEGMQKHIDELEAKSANSEQIAETNANARMEAMHKHIDDLEARLGNFAQMAVNKEDASRVPTTMDNTWNFHERSVAERIRYLEQKVDGASNWLTDPQLYENLQLDCVNMTNLGTDHRVCLDNFAQRGRKSCVVYDMGIRANPEFGARMMSDHGCSVRAYDPSPTSKKWWSGKAELNPEEKVLLNKLKAAGRNKYDFHNVGAGGKDGPFTLYEYNWNQVSIFHAENDHTQRDQDAGGQVEPDRPPKQFKLDALTLPTMMRDNQDTYIDVLKLDIEGSEYIFMQDMFDRMGCPPVGQFALEWHAFSNDPRYGSPPELNTLHNMLTACGYKMFFSHEHWRASAGYATDENGHQTNSNRNLPPMRYALASYCKDCVPTASQEENVQEGVNASQRARAQVP